MDPQQDYPMVTEAPPAKQWHFIGQMVDPVRETMIAALMRIDDGSRSPRLVTSGQDGSNDASISAHFEGYGRAEIRLNLGTGADEQGEPLIQVIYYSAEGLMEEMIIQ